MCAVGDALIGIGRWLCSANYYAFIFHHICAGRAAGGCAQEDFPTVAIAALRRSDSGNASNGDAICSALSAFICIPNSGRGIQPFPVTGPGAFWERVAQIKSRENPSCREE